jgi:hypothetical protein
MDGIIAFDANELMRIWGSFSREGKGTIDTDGYRDKGQVNTVSRYGRLPKRSVMVVRGNLSGQVFQLHASLVLAADMTVTTPTFIGYRNVLTGQNVPFAFCVASSWGQGVMMVVTLAGFCGNGLPTGERKMHSS